MNSRWATKEEVVSKLEGVNLETGVKKSGIPIGYDDKYLYIDERESHSLIIGSTGSGKTQSLILPLVKLSMMADESFVVNDVKGEIYKKCAGALKEKGYEVYALDFNDAKYGNSWNPLKMPYELYHNGEKDKAIKCLEDIAYYLFYENNTNVDPFWTNTVIDYFTGITLYLFENAKLEEVHIESIAMFSSYLNKKGNSDKFLEKIDPKSKVYLNLVPTLLAPPETRGSILSVFNQKIKRYISRENLTNMLGNSDFEIKDLCLKKTALFIISGISNYCDNLIPLLINQITDYISFIDKSPKHFNIILDEFDSMVPIRDFSRMIEFCRSLNVRFTVTIRSIVHLTNMYSREEAAILKMCFGNIIYLLSDDIHTLAKMSEYCGKKTNDIPLISIEELKTLEIFECIVLMPRMMPIKSKLLPDYKIDWGIEFRESSIPERKINTLEYYNEK